MGTGGGGGDHDAIDSRRNAMTAQPTVATDPLTDAADEPYRGCGWFESSAELAEGLIVVESREPELVLEIYFPGVVRRTGAAPGRAHAGCH
jgi:hypothetical protein